MRIEPPDEAVTQPGDLWILGDHRLLCGDSSSPADLDRLLNGSAIHLINSDPPYNVKVEPRSNNAIAAGLSSFAGPKHHQSLDVARHPEKSKPTGKMRAKDRPLANDFMSDEAFNVMLDAWFGNMSRVLQPGRGFYVWGGYANCANYPPFLKKHDLYFSQAIIWDKQHPVLTRKDFMGAHEWCQPPDTMVATPFSPSRRLCCHPVRMQAVAFGATGNRTPAFGSTRLIPGSGRGSWRPVPRNLASR
jgi:DNA modification methylase